MVQLVRHPQTKERDTDRLHLNHRAHLSTLLSALVLTLVDRFSRRNAPINQGIRNCCFDRSLGRVGVSDLNA